MNETKPVFRGEQDGSFHLSILQDISQLINFSDNFQDTLNKIVNLVAFKLNMDVCSIYMLDPGSNELILKATKGLNPDSLGLVRLKIGEGVTYMVIEEMRPIAIHNVQEHPRFAFFKEAEEQDFNSFLGIPITEKNSPIGVLVVQNKGEYYFHINEINMLQILATQVSSVIQVARVLEKTVQQGKDLELTEEQSTKEPEESEINDSIEVSVEKKVFSIQGMATSFGYGYGKVLVLDERFNYSVISDRRVEDSKEELASLEEAIKRSKDEIINIKKDLQEEISADILKIFDSHLMILDDRQLYNKIKELIEKGNNAAYATLQIIDQYVETFSQFSDPYIKEKVVDIEDIGRRIINNILGLREMDLSSLSEPCVVVAKFLTPSTTANLDTTKVVGIVTEHGGTTSHASILARSLEIPAVVGVSNLTSRISFEDWLIVDGSTGFVFVNPPNALVSEYQKKAELEIHEYHNYFLRFTEGPLETKDGHPINIGVNIGTLSDVKAAKKNGASSVGLFRTEFLYMTRSQLPTDEEQYEIYKEIVEEFPEGELIIRTLDLGGDKLLSYLPFPSEENPCLGYKSTRFLLDHPKILFDQLKAILRASHHGNIKILFPMISSLSELIQLKDFLEIAKGTLTYNGHQFNEHLEVGMMIEVPSVIFQLHDFVREVDFFSIGTNDLIQYILAVDRDNEKVSNIYNPLHPAVLRAVDTISRKVRDSGKRLAVCGEMAGRPQTSLALLALGIRDLSASPASLPYIHYLVKHLDQGVLDEVRDKILGFTDVREVEFFINKKIKEIAPKL